MKKWIIKITVTLLALFLLIGLVPFSKDIHYSGTAYEFSLAADGAVAEHTVQIDGTYSTILFLKDRFWGTFYVSDVQGLTEDMRVVWKLEPRRWHFPYFLGEAGQPHSTELVKLFFDRNFEQVALQLATKYEIDGDILSVAADEARSNFIVLGAENKEEALIQYRQLLTEKQLRPWWQFWL